MQAKITYTVDLHKIPSKVSGLLEEIKSEIEDLSREISKIQTMTEEFSNVPIAIAHLEQASNTLLGTENQLQDCKNILSGYFNALTDLNTQLKGEQEREVPANDNDTSKEG